MLPHAPTPGSSRQFSVDARNSQLIESPYVAPFDQFPPLERGRTRKIRDALKKGTTDIALASAWLRRHETWEAAPEQRNQARNRGGVAEPVIGGTLLTASSPAGQPEPSVATKPKTMAYLVREKIEIEGPQAFEPDKIRNIGSVSLHNGITAIYFSGEETTWGMLLWGSSRIPYRRHNRFKRRSTTSSLPETTRGNL